MDISISRDFFSNKKLIEKQAIILFSTSMFYLNLVMFNTSHIFLMRFTVIFLTLPLRCFSAIRNPKYLSNYHRNPRRSIHQVNSRSLTTLTQVMSGTVDGFVDVHCHLTHESLLAREDAIAADCKEKGVEYCIVNGLNPVSNREVLNICERNAPQYLPALG